LSIFREHRSSADRSASDRSRHKKKIEKAIRDGITDIVAEESIIGQDGKKRIKIPVRGIKEWQFVYGDNVNQKKIGSAPGQDIEQGQVVKKGQPPGSGSGAGKAGKDKGEEMYEVEITLDELAEYLFESLNLPDLDKKKIKTIMHEKPRRHGTRTDGIRPRLDKKLSAIQRIKRKASAKKSGEIEIDPETGEEIFPFHDNDLRYHHIKSKPKESSNAVVFFMMDVSGSMTKDIKYTARSFFFVLYQFLRYKYENLQIVFISHTTEAHEVDEDAFFKRVESGGTYVSSAPVLAKKIALERFHPSSWNIYAFHCTDGDNWSEDNPKLRAAFNELVDISQMVSYNEILQGQRSSSDWKENVNDTAWGHLVPLQSQKFKMNIVYNAQDIWPVFKKLFGGLENV
jgi:sporulation protein YhbH